MSDTGEARNGPSVAACGPDAADSVPTEGRNENSVVQRSQGANAGESPSGRLRRAADLVEPPRPYEPHRRRDTWQPPAAPDTVRATLAARYARLLWPGPVGDQLADDLDDWAKDGWRYDVRGRGPALMADIERRYRDMTLGRTYG